MTFGRRTVAEAEVWARSRVPSRSLEEALEGPVRRCRALRPHGRAGGVCAGHVPIRGGRGRGRVAAPTAPAAPVALAASGLTEPAMIGIIAMIVVVALAVYAGSCWWFPFAVCRRCDGAGKFRSSSGRSWRRCRRCRGSGERLRVGRRLWNALKRRRDAGRG